MEHCNPPSTLVTQGSRSHCSTGDVKSQAAAGRIIKLVEKAEEPDKYSGVKEEDIKLNTAAMVPKAHMYARSELGIMRPSRCATSCKINVPTQRKQWIDMAARRHEQHIVPEEAIYAAQKNFPNLAHEAQRKECAPKPSHRGDERENHVRDFIIKPATMEVPAASTVGPIANTQSSARVNSPDQVVPGRRGGRDEPPLRRL